MCRSMVDIQSATAEIRQGKNQEEEERKRQDKNIMSESAMQGGHNQLAMYVLCTTMFKQELFWDAFAIQSRVTVG